MHWACREPGKGSRLGSEKLGLRNWARRTLSFKAARDVLGLTFSHRKVSYIYPMRCTASIRLAARGRILLPTVRMALLPLVPLTMLIPFGGASLLRAQIQPQMQAQPQTQAAQPAPADPLSTGSSLAKALAPGQSAKLSVDYDAGKLCVNANDASLNQILNEVARRIGMKVTGEVADERVFGQYGPAAPAAVLAALLDGTGSNMLLVGDAKGPRELILTARQGGPTPPSSTPAPAPPPVAAEPAPAPEQMPAQEQAPIPRTRPQRRTIGVPRMGAGEPPSQPPDTSPDGSTPNGSNTPQQIYNQLRQQQLQQQQQDSPPPPPPPQ
jgi:hypothetical protein